VLKKAAWSRPLPLSDIKAIKNVTGGTVNDVLITAMIGGLRRYMLSRHEEVDRVDFRATVPVNLRTPEEMGELGNKFGLVYLKLPVYIEDVQERLQEVSQRMTALKNSSEAVVALGILSGIGLTPADVQQQLVNLFGAKATAVMTNVPGPPMPLYMAGAKITDIMFWVPLAGRVALGISIISYAGKVWLGVATDAGLVPDPDLIIDGFYEEYELLMDLVKTAK
jgi:WS/DGAT/MGAT family acyltransferase